MGKRIGIGKEGYLHINFNTQIESLKLDNQLKINRYHYSTSGEKRSLATGALLKRKGAKKGLPDFEFCYRGSIENINNIDFTLYIEFKVENNKQTKEQKDFENLYLDSRTKFYYVAYSVKEAINILKQHNLIKL
jgi:hypothetical protein